jgi:hypothetical protein
MVQMVKKSCPRMGEIEETTDWCTSAVESIVFPLIFTTLFAMYEIKVRRSSPVAHACTLHMPAT